MEVGGFMGERSCGVGPKTMEVGGDGGLVRKEVVRRWVGLPRIMEVGGNGEMISSGHLVGWLVVLCAR